MGREHVRQAVENREFTNRTRGRAIQWLRFDQAETQRKQKQRLIVISVALAVGLFIVLKGVEIYMDGSIDFEAVAEVFEIWFGDGA